MHLFLDIDETLIHTSTKKIESASFVFTLSEIKYYVLVRPGLTKFMQYVFKNFESVNIWTAATKEYAHIIMKHILTEKQYTKLKFFNTRTHIIAGAKPLSVIFRNKEAIALGIKPENTIMIDDKPSVLKHNEGNGIVIPAWRGDDTDKYLLKLIVVMKGILEHKIKIESNTKYLKLVDITDTEREREHEHDKTK